MVDREDEVPAVRFTHRCKGRYLLFLFRIHSTGTEEGESDHVSACKAKNLGVQKIRSRKPSTWNMLSNVPRLKAVEKVSDNTK